MKKLSLTQILALLKEAGVEVAVSETDAVDFNPGDYLKQIDAARLPFIKPGIETEFNNNANTAYKGRYLADLRKLVKKQFGLTDEVVKDLEAEDLVKLAHTNATVNAGKDTETLRAEIQALTSNTEAMVNKLKADHEAALKAKTGEYQRRDIIGALSAVLEKLPRTGGVLTAQSEAFLTHLESKYGVQWDETGKRPTLRDKSNPVLDAKDPTGTMLIKLEDEGKAYLESMGVLKTDSRGVNPIKAMGGGNNGAHVENPIQGAGSSRMAAVKNFQTETTE